MMLFDTSEEPDVTLIESKALYKVVDWKKLAFPALIECLILRNRSRPMLLEELS